jgi:hypothetical protein
VIDFDGNASSNPNIAPQKSEVAACHLERRRVRAEKGELNRACGEEL